MENEENHPEQLIIDRSIDFPKSKNKHENIPKKHEILKWMKKLNLPRNIIKHELAVMREARDIAHNITKSPVNSKLVKIGALIHDIGRIQTHTLAHGPFGGDIIRQAGLPEELARIAERHSMAGLSPKEAKRFDLPNRNYIPQTLEEKIVCLADKYHIGSQKVSIQERFDRWIAKYGETDLLQNQFKRALQLEEEILRLIF